MRRQFRDTALELAAEDDRLVVILGDISHYLFSGFQERFPERFYNMGICENTLIGVTAGLSALGYFPIVHSIAPFLTERCVEQIKIDMVYNAFGGNIVTCGGPFDYAWDGPSHHCYTDLATLRLLPHVEVMQPGSRKELDVLLRSQYRNARTSYFKTSDNPHEIDLPVRFGKGQVVKSVGSAVTVVTAGPILGNVLEACRDLPVNLLYFTTLKPMDHELIRHYRDTRFLVVHDAFGLHEAVNEVPNLRTRYYGLRDEFCDWYGTVQEIREKLGLDPASIRRAVQGELDGGGERG